MRAEEKVGPQTPPRGTDNTIHHQVADTPTDTGSGQGQQGGRDEELPEISFLQKLVKLGCAIWLAEATQPGEPDHGYTEFHRPFGWQQNRPEALERMAEGFRNPTDLFPNTPAICANMGGVVVVVDVDPRNGGDIEKVRALLHELTVRVFAEVTTPSEGKHFYIAGHPDLPTVHSTAENKKLAGFPGVDIQSYGTNVFLPGTYRRKKYNGAGYTIECDHLDELISQGDPEGADRFAAWVADQTASHIRSSATGTDRAEFQFDPAPHWDETPPDERQQKYLDTALAAEAKKVSEAKPGGRNDALNIAALKMGHYVAGAGLTQDTVIEALELAAIGCGLADEDGGVESVRATIGSGLRAGIKTPRAVPAEKADKKADSHQHREIEWISLEDIEDAAPQWGWTYDGHGRIQIAALTLFGGRPGTGKSTAARWFAARLSRGELEGCWYGKPQTVAYIAAGAMIETCG